MTNGQKLVWVRSIHTLIWVLFNLVFIYLFYAVITDSLDYRFWIGVGSIVLETLVLLAFRWSCPLTVVARKYSSSTKANFDIYLPLWLARYNKVIYSTLFIILILIYLLKMF